MSDIVLINEEVELIEIVSDQEVEVIEVITDNVEVISVGEPGPPGPEGPQGQPGMAGSNTYIHNQMVASAEWIITHALGAYPSVTIVDSAGSVVVGDASYISTQELRVSFNSAFAGLAYLN
jgi:hypothetical protein